MSLGIALLLAGLFFDGGRAQSPELQATPTPNRLAEPTLPPVPSQADRGAQVFWLSCLPCHGDKGQGLTDEFRAVYPAEDQNCWQIGCHGKRPYDKGFTIPTTIPAVIGPATLSKFSNAAQLAGFIRAAMPFWRPGSLTEDEAWKITAFILRENNLWSGAVELNASNAEDVVIPSGGVPAISKPQQAEVQQGSEAIALVMVVGPLVLLAVLMFIHKKSRNKTTI